MPAGQLPPGRSRRRTCDARSRRLGAQAARPARCAGQQCRPVGPHSPRRPQSGDPGGMAAHARRQPDRAVRAGDRGRTRLAQVGRERPARLHRQHRNSRRFAAQGRLHSLRHGQGRVASRHAPAGAGAGAVDPRQLRGARPGRDSDGRRLAGSDRAVERAFAHAPASETGGHRRSGGRPGWQRLRYRRDRHRRWGR
jgi:hypothetical protein